MVDPVSGTGALQGVSGVQRTQGNLDKQKAEQTRQSAPADEVEISAEALSQQQAEEAAGVARGLLAQTEYYLGLDPAFDTEA